MLENLKKLREGARVSQRILAENIGVSQQSINKYENHNIEPDIFTLCALADYFDTSIDYLVGRVEEEGGESSYLLTPDEARHLRGYRRLDQRGKRCADGFIKCYNEKE